MDSSSEKLADNYAFEVAVVYSVPNINEKEKSSFHSHEPKPDDAIECFMKGLRDEGLLLEEVEGLTSERFIKIAAPIEVIGRTADKLQMRKSTHIGLDVPFDWESKDEFVLQLEDDSLFSWTERYDCLYNLLYGVVNTGEEDVALLSPGETKQLIWGPGEALLSILMSEKIVKDVLILHDETRRKSLLSRWGLNWTGFASQPIDAIMSYFGPKVAIYFAFLGMYTQWLVIPSVLGIIFYFKDLGPWESVVPPAFSILAVSWAVLFLQFWKRKNASLLARWNQRPNQGWRKDPSDKHLKGKHQEGPHSRRQKQALQKEEWLEHFKSLRNNIAVVAGILCLQLPFEILYAHFSYVIKSPYLNFLLTGIYLSVIQKFTKIGGRFAERLTKSESYSTKEAEADNLVYKVFGVYFMQTYIGLLYHALFQRDFAMLRQFLYQRLVISEVMNNFSEMLVPYAMYCYAKYKTFRSEEEDKSVSQEKSKHQMSRIEKEYLKPSYAASISSDLEDGLFDDFLELALQFGMVTMFASAFPLVFPFALINNLMEIRTDSLKLLVTLRRPVPRAASSIGAWLNIFQFLGTTAICSNCALLVGLFDQQGTWTLEPELGAILLMEHILLLAKFGFSCFVPEEPAWVKAKRMRKKVIKAKYSRRILHHFDVQNTN